MLVESQRVKDFKSSIENDMSVVYETDYAQMSEGELAGILAHDLDLIEFISPELLTPPLVDYLIKNVANGFKVIRSIVAEHLDNTRDLYSADHVVPAVQELGSRAIELFSEYAFTPEVIVEAAQIDPKAYSAMPESVKSQEISAQICKNDFRAFPHIPPSHHTPEIFYRAVGDEYRNDRGSLANVRSATPACWDQKTANTVYESYRDRKELLIKLIPEQFHTYRMYKELKGTKLDHLSSKTEILGVQNARDFIESDASLEGIGNVKKWMVEQTKLSVGELTDVVVNPNRDMKSDLQAAMRYSAMYHLGALSESAFAKSVAEDARLAPVAEVLKSHRAPEAVVEGGIEVPQVTKRGYENTSPNLG